MTEPSIVLATFSERAKALITNQGIVFKLPLAGSFERLSADLQIMGTGSVALAFRQVLPILLEQEVALLNEGYILIPTERVFTLYQNEYGLSPFLPDLCPYWLEIDCSGTIGFPELHFQSKFYSGIDRVSITRTGAFITRASNIYVLPETVYQLLNVIDRFHSLSPDDRSDKSVALRALYQMKQYACAGVSFKSYLAEQTIVIANKVGVDVEQDSAGRITLVPIISGVPPDEMRRIHLRYNDPQQVYEIRNDNSALRVVTSDEVRQAIKLMNKYRRVGGRQRENFLADPLGSFSKVTSLDAVDLGPLDEKIQSLGPYIYRSKIRIRSKPRDIPVSETNPFSRSAEQAIEAIEITAIDSIGSPVQVSVSAEDSETLRLIDADIKEAEKEKQNTVSIQFAGKAQTVLVALTKELKEGVQALIENTSTIKKIEAELIGRAPKHLDAIETVLELAQESAELEQPPPQESLGLDTLHYEKPAALQSRINGKPLLMQTYQKHGIAWLQHCFRLSLTNLVQNQTRRHGTLLADDMGLGKTLQVLTFLAWCIEKNFVKQGAPILVISPLILLPVWDREIKKFFYAEGSVFNPREILHGDRLNQYKVVNPVGEKGLSVDRLRNQVLIITNYDTVKTNIHSFQQLHYSVVILDEAQEIKDPKTNISKCVKELDTVFSLAVTGTPVENRLLDLWSIMDFAQPGLLGSQKQFLKDFDPTGGANPQIEENHATMANELRSRLLFHTPDAFVIRRTKDGSLDGLPPKNHILRLTPLSKGQTERHFEISNELAEGGSEGKHLAAIQRLVKIYQHPSLEYESVVTEEPGYYLEQSFKLQDLLNLLYEIKRRKEKTLIFTRYINMQLILQRVLECEFGHFDIINGANNQGGTRPELRQRIIDQFEQKPGFNGLILSPDVAGVGLTITGANNVIHYGRWWNPAKESQATDRVYRLGQERPVNVYQLVSTATDFMTFDERLHLMLSAKSRLASDFLIPTDNMVVNESELISALVAEVPGLSASTTLPLSAQALKSLSPRHLEALTAAIWRAQGFETYLLPSSLTGVVRVIGVKRQEVQLVTSTTRSDTPILEHLRDLDESCKFLQGKLSIGKLRNSDFRRALAFNFNLPKKASEQIRKTGATVLAESDLLSVLKTQQISAADLFREENLRFRSLDDLLEKIGRS